MTAPQFSVPLDKRYFEDYVAGPVYEYGPVSVSEAEIIRFAEKFDPQYIHIDPQKSLRGPFGGLISSGWHTASLAMRLYAENFILPAIALAPPAFDDLRWVKPVRPGDSLSIRVSVIDSGRSESQPNTGSVRVFLEVLNQNRETVMTAKITNRLLCRPAPSQTT